MNTYTKLSIIAGILLAGGIAAAVTIGMGEPPAAYINNLKTCKQSYAKTGTSYIQEFKINGKLTDGRCSVTLTSYTNLDNPQTLKDALFVAKAFMEGSNSTVSDDELIKKIKSGNKKSVDNCKFTQEQINSLVTAYAKHDGTNPQGSTTRDKDGNLTGFSGSFSTSNMSSYDKLMTSMMYSCTSTVQ